MTVLGRKLLPRGQGCRAIEFESLPVVEMSFLIEVVMD